MVGHLLTTKVAVCARFLPPVASGTDRPDFCVCSTREVCFSLGSAYVLANSKIPEYGQLEPLLVGVVLALTWAIVPIVFTGLDGTWTRAGRASSPSNPSTCRRASYWRVRVVSPGIRDIVRCCWALSRFLSQPLALIVPPLLRGSALRTLMVWASRKPSGDGAER